jgi:hypothetical protein
MRPRKPDFFAAGMGRGALYVRFRIMQIVFVNYGTCRTPSCVRPGHALILLFDLWLRHTTMRIFREEFDSAFIERERMAEEANMVCLICERQDFAPDNAH